MIKGQCGNGTDYDTTGQNNYILAPEQIGSDTWLTIAAGSEHSLGIKSDDTLWAWGYNVAGQLGTGNSIKSLIPIQIGTSNNWEKVFTYQRTSFAIKTDGSLWSWGENAYGLLGRTIDNFDIPVRVGVSNNWVSLSVTSQYISVIKSDGTLWIWGANRYSVLDNGYYGNGIPDTNNYENNPTQIGVDTNWQSTANFYYGSLAIKNNGTLWGWGKNQYGELGDGTSTTRYTPVQIGIDNDWSSLYSNKTAVYAYAIKQNHSAYQWGVIGNYGPLSISTPTLFDTGCILNNNSFDLTTTIKVSPNPFNSSISLAIVTTLNEGIDILVYDTVGKLIERRNINYSDIENIEIGNNYASGIYNVIVSQGEFSKSIRIIKD